MGALKNARHELFAQTVAKGISATEAYRSAGYSAVGNSAEAAASRLLKDVKVAARVAEITNKAAARVVVTIESLSQELEEARAIALKERQSSAAVQATMGKAKLFGLGVENRRLSGTVQVVTITADKLDSLSDEDLAVLERAYPVLRKLGLVGDPAAEGEAGG